MSNLGSKRSLEVVLFLYFSFETYNNRFILNIPYSYEYTQGPYKEINSLLKNITVHGIIMSLLTRSDEANRVFHTTSSAGCTRHPTEIRRGSKEASVRIQSYRPVSLQVSSVSLV